MVSSTTPYNTFVLPVTNESITVKMERISNTVDVVSIPSSTVVWLNKV